MTDAEQQLMAQYGITCESKMQFHFQGHSYDRLADAVNYAEKIPLEKTSESGKPEE